MSTPANVLDFYSERYWNLPFGAWGKDYSIALAPNGGGYHIGLDLAAADGEAIPALVGGTVHHVQLTGTMAWIVVLRGDDGLYYSYCHMANDNLPRSRDRIEQGGRVGRAANGPKGISAGNPDFPGSAWNGRHLHLVITGNAYAAYTFVPGYRTLSAFIDPADRIRAVLASTARDESKPFNPEAKEWDEMASKEDIKAVVLEALGTRPNSVLIHYSGAGRNGIYLAAPGYWHQFTAEQWKQFQDHGLRLGIRELIPVNDRDFDVFKEIYTVNQGMVSSLTDTQLASITKSVQDSLKNLSVDAEVDDATIEKIANAAIDKLVARAKE